MFVLQNRNCKYTDLNLVCKVGTQCKIGRRWEVGTGSTSDGDGAGDAVRVVGVRAGADQVCRGDGLPTAGSEGKFCAGAPRWWRARDAIIRDGIDSGSDAGLFLFVAEIRLSLINGRNNIFLSLLGKLNLLLKFSRGYIISFRINRIIILNIVQYS